MIISVDLQVVDLFLEFMNGFEDTFLEVGSRQAVDFIVPFIEY